MPDRVPSFSRAFFVSETAGKYGSDDQCGCARRSTVWRHQTPVPNHDALLPCALRFRPPSQAIVCLCPSWPSQRKPVCRLGVDDERKRDACHWLPRFVYLTSPTRTATGRFPYNAQRIDMQPGRACMFLRQPEPHLSSVAEEPHRGHSTDSTLPFPSAEQAPEPWSLDTMLVPWPMSLGILLSTVVPVTVWDSALLWQASSHLPELRHSRRYPSLASVLLHPSVRSPC